MRSENESDGQKAPSFIEQARRRQIVAAAIDTVAAQGFGTASLAAIARTAGVSKGVISYHFSGKEALMEACVEKFYSGIAERVVPKLEGLAPLDLIHEHIVAVAHEGMTNRDEMLAVTEIITHLRTKDGAQRYSITDNELLYQGLEHMYAYGRSEGALREFDHRVMAVTVQAALDSMFVYWVAHPGTDLMAHAEQLADLVIAAVRNPGGST